MQSPLRPIRSEEKTLIQFLLFSINLNPQDYAIPELVDDYEGGIMGSIGMGSAEPNNYGGDFVQVKYIDTDNIPVVITLTKDKEGKLLDLDFWKEDFSKLLQYPKPENIVFQ
jgi:hypothetical protein